MKCISWLQNTDFFSVAGTFRLIQVLEIRIIGIPDIQRCEHFPLSTGFWHIEVPFQMCFTIIKKWNINSRNQAAVSDLALQVIECQTAAKKDFKERNSDILLPERPGRRYFKPGPGGLLGETTLSKIAKTEFLLRPIVFSANVYVTHYILLRQKSAIVI